MAILLKQKEMFCWNNVNIRQKCWRLIKAKLLSFSNNADTETSVPGERKKADRLQVSKKLLGTNQYFIVDIFSRGKSCFVKLKIVSMAKRIKR